MELNQVILVSITIVMIGLVLGIGIYITKSIVDTDTSEDESVYVIKSTLTDATSFVFVAEETACPLFVETTNSLGVVYDENFTCLTSTVEVNATNITNGNNEIRLRFTI